MVEVPMRIDQMRDRFAAELGEHGVEVNGVNPDGVVQGSGIFAGGWGAQRAEVYGVEEKDLGAFYAQRTILKREVLKAQSAKVQYVSGASDTSEAYKSSLQSAITKAHL